MITEMLAKGMTRDEVAQELVRRGIVPTIKDAQVRIAFALGETTGDLLHIQGREPDLVIRTLSGAQ